MGAANGGMHGCGARDVRDAESGDGHLVHEEQSNGRVACNGGERGVRSSPSSYIDSFLGGFCEE